MARTLDANIRALAARPAEPDREARGFRIRDAPATFRFAELLTRPPNPRHIQSSSWGDGFFDRPSPGSSGDCSLPTPPGIARPRHGRSRWVQALAVPTTAPCPKPLGFPDRVPVVPAGSEPWQFQRLPRARSPCDSPTVPWKFPRGPSPGSSGGCPVPRAPGIPRPRSRHSRRVRAFAVPATAPRPHSRASSGLTLSIPGGSKPRQIRRVLQALSSGTFPPA